MQKVRDAAARLSSQNNLKQIGLATHNVLLVNNTFPLANYYPQTPNPDGTYTSVYAAVLERWLHADSKAILGEAFTPAPIFDPARVNG